MIPAAMWPKVSVCSHLIAGIMGMNHAEDMDVCLVFVVCCVRDVLCDGLFTCSEGVLLGVCVCVCVCVCIYVWMSECVCVCVVCVCGVCGCEWVSEWVSECVCDFKI